MSVFKFIVEGNENGSVTIASRAGEALHVLVRNGKGWERDGVYFNLSPRGLLKIETREPVGDPLCRLRRTS